MYGPDLSYIHHAGWQGRVRVLTPAVLDVLRGAGLAGGHVLELGCGDGTLLAALTRAGYAATGIEQSPTLGRYARQAAPGATIRVGSLHRLAYPRCHAIVALGEVLNYRSGADRRRTAFPSVFARAYAALRPGGVLVFDLLVSGRRMSYDHQRAGRTWLISTHVEEDLKRRRLIRDITTFRQVGRLYRRRVERHVQEVPARQAITSQLRAIGFRVRVTRRFGAYMLEPRRVMFVARKPRERPLSAE